MSCNGCAKPVPYWQITSLLPWYVQDYIHHYWGKEPNVTHSQAYSKFSRPSDHFWAPVVRLEEVYPMMVVLASTWGMEQAKGPVVSSRFSAGPCPQCCLLRSQQRNPGPTGLLCISGLQVGVTGLGRSNRKTQPKLLHPTASSATWGFLTAECLSTAASHRHNTWCKYRLHEVMLL